MSSVRAVALARACADWRICDASPLARETGAGVMQTLCEGVLARKLVEMAKHAHETQAAAHEPYCVLACSVLQQ